MPPEGNHKKARRASLQKAREAKRAKTLLANNELIVEHSSLMEVEDKNKDEEAEVEDATLSTESKLNILISNLTTMILDFIGEDSPPDTIRLITFTLRSKMIEALPFFCDDVEVEEDFSSSDISRVTSKATAQWNKFLKYDEKKLKKNGINGNKRGKYMVGGEYSDRTIRAHKLKGKKNEKLAKLTANPILQFGFTREVEQQHLSEKLI